MGRGRLGCCAMCLIAFVSGQFSALFECYVDITNDGMHDISRTEAVSVSSFLCYCLSSELRVCCSVPVFGRHFLQLLLIWLVACAARSLGVSPPPR